MRKVFTVVIIIFTCLFVYFGAKMLWEYLNEVSIVMSDSLNEASTSGTFAFKTTPENLELINSYLKVNNSFINEMSKEVIVENSIDNIYSLVNGFPSFKNYYSARLKLEKAIFEGLPYLITEALTLSGNELENFFKDNLEYLDKTFGITEFEQFNNVITNLTYLQNKEIKYAEIPDSSAVYNPYGGSTIFRIKAGNDLNDFVYFSINAYHGYDTKNQKAPVIVFNALGGMS